MQKWGYKLIKGWSSELELNKLGAEGWELVSVAAAGSETKGIDTACVYLRRPISN